MQATRKTTPTEKALTARGLTPYAHVDAYPGQDDAEALVIGCDRCGQRGRIEQFAHYADGLCFDCHGTGVLRHTTVGEERKRDRDVINRMNRSWLRNEKEAEAARAARDAERAETAEKRAAFLASHDGLADALEALPGDFGVSLRAALNDRGTLTDNQVDAALRVAAEVRDRGPVDPVVEGRGVIAGTVRSVKVVDTDFGTTLKMIVEDDRGFRLYGTVPSAIVDDVEVGDRVEFTARAVASDDDKAFGFFSRPSKARIV